MGTEKIASRIAERQIAEKSIIEFAFLAFFSEIFVNSMLETTTPIEKTAVATVKVMNRTSATVRPYLKGIKYLRAKLKPATITKKERYMAVFTSGFQRASASKVAPNM